MSLRSSWAFSLDVGELHRDKTSSALCHDNIESFRTLDPEKMSRSATDATRFTATAPHAYTKTSPPRATNKSSTVIPSSQSQRPSNPPDSQAPRPQSSAAQPVETPAQKVARLRAEHAANKLGQFSRWDRIVVRGRYWADKAHRVTTYTLVGFTGEGTSAYTADIERREPRLIFSPQSLLVSFAPSQQPT